MSSGRLAVRVRASVGRCIFLAAAGLVGSAGFGLMAGCGTPAAPQPPSLKLPEQVQDLTAVRAGDAVTLHWTNPKKTTDHLLIQGSIAAEICRVGRAEACETAGTTSAMPGAQSEFHETLPAALLAGEPRVIRYFVELKNMKGRTAGPSNMAEILAGSAPGPVAGLSAEVRADGVALHWDSADGPTAVRLHRKLLTPPTSNGKTGATVAQRTEPKTGQKAGLMQAPKEPVESDLIVEKPAAGARSGALDDTARFGESYEYRVQRVTQVKAGGAAPENGAALESGAALELAGPFSAPVRVDVIDRFPPGVPQGLVAVAAAQEKSIDLSWEPDTDADLAGYIVYRAVASEAGASDWVRVSGAQPLAAAAYRDLTVEAGRAYRYRVTAVDETGHESAPSAEAQESMPNPENP